MATDEVLSVIELEENLADVEKPKELPPGTYPAEVQNIEQKTDKNGKSYLAIGFKVAPENVPADMSEQVPDGINLYVNYLEIPSAKSTQRAKWQFKQFMLALGLDVKTSSIDPNEWMGRPARIVVRTGKDQAGEPRAEIARLEAGEAPAKAPAKAPARGARK